MNTLFEYTDRLKKPYECFIFDTALYGLPVHPHWHYFMEIIYMIEGTAIMNCDEESHVVTPGDLILFLPYQVHSIYSVSNQTVRYYVCKFDLGTISSESGMHFQRLFQNARGKDTAPLYFPAGKLDSERLQSVFEISYHEASLQCYGFHNMLQNQISTLLILILRFWQNIGFNTECIQSAREEESIYYITEYIDRHIQDSLKVEYLAERCHMSYPYFAKCFRELYGQSCKKYIEFIRMCKAEDLLISTGLDLNYISQETGFSDCSHFIKAFKQKNGVTPKQYRKQHRNQP